MKALYFINSSPSFAIPAHLTCQSNNELSILGQKQASAIAETLVQEMPPNRFLRILTAPDTCSQRMAEILAGFSVQLPKTVNAFNTIDLGDWSGQSLETILASDRARFLCWQRDSNYPAPGGESITDFSRRTWTELVNEVDRSTEDEDLVFFVPEKLIAVVACQVLDAPLVSAHLLSMRDTGITTFRKNDLGFFQLESWCVPWNVNLGKPEKTHDEKAKFDSFAHEKEETQILPVSI